MTYSTSSIRITTVIPHHKFNVAPSCDVKIENVVLGFSSDVMCLSFFKKIFTFAKLDSIRSCCCDFSVEVQFSREQSFCKASYLQAKVLFAITLL